MPMQFISKQFVGDAIAVEFGTRPSALKNPSCPQRFCWRGASYVIEELVEEWRDHARKGRMARNQRAAHLRRASQVGSWGVGRIYFRVRVQEQRYFDLYYDRAPAGGHPHGQWFLFRELEPVSR